MKEKAKITAGILLDYKNKQTLDRVLNASLN